MEGDIDGFKNFNQFFIRKLKKEARPVCEAPDLLACPADGRLLAYEKIDCNRVFLIKDKHFKLTDFIKNRALAHEYDNGSFICIRLCPSDYHRFHFPDSGVARKPVLINGYYYSVSPIALKRIPGLFCENKRIVTIFDSESFGKILIVEIGATCVGSIVQTFKTDERVSKGDEKGYFQFGGSSIVMLFKKGSIKIDDDLLSNTQKELETLVRMGERIGMVAQE
ncbi:MAG: archaetidylserine decarboxylase [bacterium]